MHNKDIERIPSASAVDGITPEETMKVVKVLASLGAVAGAVSGVAELLGHDTVAGVAVFTGLALEGGAGMSFLSLKTSSRHHH